MKTLAILFCFVATGLAALQYTGVNLASYEFGTNIPGVYNTDYTMPTNTEIDYFVTTKKMNIIRFPFKWERLQRTLSGAFDATELGRMDAFITYTTGKGAYVLLDPHNYARYGSNIIGDEGSPVTIAHWEDFNTKLANQWKNNPLIIFGIMNEPHTMPTQLWRQAAQAAINAIRATGATNLILVPGNAWTGAHSWTQTWYGAANSVEMLAITDPGNNYAFEIHQYLDDDSSGREASCTNENAGVDRLTSFTAWAKTNNKKALLGEFAGGRNTVCYNAITKMLQYMEANSDVYIGYTWWAAGPWWDEYIFTLEPAGATDRPQMDVLEAFINLGTTGGTTTSTSGASTTTTSTSTSGSTSTTTSGTGNTSGGKACSQNSDCANNVCLLEGVCLGSCTSSSQCPSGVCLSSGLCYEEGKKSDDELENGGSLSTGAQIGVGVGTAGGVLLVGGVAAVGFFAYSKNKKKRMYAAYYRSRPTEPMASADGAYDKPLPTPGGKTLPKVPPAPGSSPWQETVDPQSGAVYYYNTVTGESTWDKPY